MLVVVVEKCIGFVVKREVGHHDETVSSQVFQDEEGDAKRKIN